MRTRIRQVVRSYIGYLGTHCPDHHKAFLARLAQNEHGAWFEAAMFSVMQYEAMPFGSVRPDEDPSTGGADFLCSMSGGDFHLEVTHIDNESVTQKSSLPDEIGDGVHMHRLITDKLMRVAWDKDQQLSGSSLPQVVAIGSYHVHSSSLFDTLAAQFLLTGETKFAFPIGGKPGDGHEETDLKDSVFFRLGRDGKLESCRRNISALLLVSCGADTCDICGVLNPDPVAPFDLTLLPNIPFVRLRQWPPNDGKLDVEWVVGSPDTVRRYIHLIEERKAMMPKIPKRIVLDSCIFCHDFQMAGVDFKLLRDAVQRTGCKLTIPQVVIDEVRNKFREHLRRDASAIDKKVREFRNNYGHGASWEGTLPQIETIAGAYDAHFEDQLLQLGAEIAPYPDLSHEDVVKRELSRRKPFAAKGTGYRDFLIWQAVLAAASADESGVAFVTNNLRDFAGEGNKLHDDLNDDLTRSGLEGKVALCPSLRQFNDTYIMPQLQTLDTVKAKLSRGRYDKFDLGAALPGLLEGLLLGSEVDNDDVNLRSEFETPTVTGIDLLRFKVLGVRKLFSGELLVSVEAEATCDLDFHVYKADFFVLQEEDVAAGDWDWNEKYMTAGKQLDMNVIVNLTLDPDSGEVTTSSIFSVSAG